MRRTYPFGEARSKQIFPNRMNPILNDGKVQLIFDIGKFPNFTEMSRTQEGLHGFFLDRIADYDQALNAAEDQINDIQTPRPFIPEDLGFKEIKSESLTAYVCGQCRISRHEGDTWFIQIHNTMLPVAPIIPDMEAARTIFIALGVITGEEVTEPSIVKDVKLSEEEMAKAIILTEQSIEECSELLANPDLGAPMREKIEKRKSNLESELNKFQNGN